MKITKKEIKGVTHTHTHTDYNNNQYRIHLTFPLPRSPSQKTVYKCTQSHRRKFCGIRMLYVIVLNLNGNNV